MVSGFAIIASVVAVLMIAHTIMEYYRRNIASSWALFWGGIWVVGALAVLFSSWTDAISEFLIGDTGNRLIVYVSIILLFILVYRIMLTLRRTEESISSLVEMLARRDVKKK